MKELYKLDTENHILPELSSEEDLLVWGQNIIDGERERIRQGGFPIYNPAINKVKVYYDIFKEHQVNHMLHKKTTDRVVGNLEALRTQADELILSIWNQVEEFYKDKLPYERMRSCQAYGIIYYYRTGETHLTRETDIALQRQQASQPTLQWSDPD